MHLAWAAAVAVLVVYPLALLFRLSFDEPDGGRGLGNYATYFGDRALVRATFNSLWTAFATTIGCIVIGVPLAFLVARTDVPGKRIVQTTAVLTFAIPGFIAAMGWILLLGPRSGMLNTPLQSLFGLDEGPFDIFSPWGVVFVLVVFLYPIVFLPSVAAFEKIEPPLEHAAASLGARPAMVFRRVTLPLVMPAIAAGSILVFASAFIAFGPVALLGGPVGFENISTAMLRLLKFPPRLEMAAVVGVPTLLVLAALLFAQWRLFGDRAFTVVTGKPGQRAPIRLGRLRWPAALFLLAVFTVSVVLPFGVLLLTAFRRAMGYPVGPGNLVFMENFQAVLDHPGVAVAFRNSLVLAAAAAVAGIAVAFLGAWIVERIPSRASVVVAPTMLAPLAFPGAIAGISLVLAYARPPFRLSGSLTIILLAYVVGNLPLAFNYLRAGLKQVDRSMEEAARSLGATWARTLGTITVPLLRGPVLVVAMLTFVLQFRDLESSIFLFTGSNAVISVILFNLAGESLFQLMGALSVLILLVTAAVVGGVYGLFGLRRRVTRRPLIGLVDDTSP